YEGMPELKVKIAEWFLNRFQVKLDPENEILILGGSKEGLSLAPVAFLDPEDYALVPDPAYPVYKTSVLLAGGKVFTFPLLKENNWLPDLKRIKPKGTARMIFLNYPNNPTGALAPRDSFQELVDFAHDKEMIICHDMAYSEITYDGLKSHSLLEIDNAKEISLEFFSFSKTYSLTGWRLGFVVGNKELIQALTQVKLTFSSGVFHPIQRAGITALALSQKDLAGLIKTYQVRRDVLVNGLKELGWDAEFPKGAIFVWAKTPEPFDSMSVSLSLIQKVGVLTTPGTGLGEQGKNHIRFSLTSSVERIEEALRKMKKFKF
ncbi:MAG: aminotransferase class I/II-fold pyridoxal phosphate-dependent enzyme, partial [Candidatus Zixiibacteriota bacterium]